MLSTFHLRVSRFPFGRPLRWLLRFRKRRGYGVHSPFAFGFITDVVYNHGEYYAYRRLRAISYVQSAFRPKDLRLLFRIANFTFAPFFFAPAAPRLLLLAVRLALPRAKRLMEEHEAQRCPAKLLIYNEAWEHLAPQHLFSLAAPEALIVVVKPHASPERRMAWQRLADEPRVRVTMDLHDFGLLFLEERLNKEDYVINYY